MTDQQNNETHNAAKSIFLHLIPGILTGICYFLIRLPLKSAGFPSIFALMISIVFVIIPVELGYLFYRGKRTTGRFTLSGVVDFRRVVPLWQYFAWSLIVFGIIGGIFTALKPVDTFLQEKLFFWMPGLETGLDGGYTKPNLMITYVAVLLFGAIAGPIVEELYFRGYLLSRTPGKLGVLWHSILFAVYHVFTPWMILTRAVGLLPLIFAVKKKSIYIGIAVHILVNAIDAIIGFVYIAGMA